MLEKISPETLREKVELIKWVFLVGVFQWIWNSHKPHKLLLLSLFSSLQACKFIEYTSSYFEESVWVSAPFLFIVFVCNIT